MAYHIDCAKLHIFVMHLNLVPNSRLGLMIMFLCLKHSSLCIPNSQWHIFKPAIGFWNKCSGHKEQTNTKAFQSHRICYPLNILFLVSLTPISVWYLVLGYSVGFNLVFLFDLYLPRIPVMLPLSCSYPWFPRPALTWYPAPLLQTELNQAAVKVHSLYNL